MDCNLPNSDQCVCDIVRVIAQKQQNINNRDGCIGSCKASIKELISPVTNNLNTIPLLFTCKNGCDFFIASGVFRDPTTMAFECIETPVFRVSKVIEDTCCAEIELLQPQTAQGTVPAFTNQDGVCRFFPANMIKKFIRTGICMTVDLNCFCGVECLPAVFAEREVPDLPEVCVNPAITIDSTSIGCFGMITGTVTCDGEPVAGAEVFLTSDPDVLTFNPNPVNTNASGNYSVFVIADPGTQEAVEVTAETTVNGIPDSTSVFIDVNCPEDGDCPGDCGIHIGTQNADAMVTVVSDGNTNMLNGKFNINILSCGRSCNPSNNNLQIEFRKPGTTFNFSGFVTDVTDCDPEAQTATITGQASVSGNNPFDNNQVFTVVVEFTATDTDSGTWEITATSGSDTFISETFTADVNPNVIKDCSS